MITVTLIFDLKQPLERFLKGLLRINQCVSSLLSQMTQDGYEFLNQ